MNAYSSYPVELLALVTSLTGVLDVTCNQPNLHPAAAVRQCLRHLSRATGQKLHLPSRTLSWGEDGTLYPCLVKENTVRVGVSHW